LAVRKLRKRIVTRRVSPTIDLRSPTTASLRLGDHADNHEIQNRVNEPSAASTVENNFILNRLGVPKEDYDATLFKLGMIAVHLGTAHTTSAERLALAIIDRIGKRCVNSHASYEDTVALSSAP
jgi:hypothetical protein